MYNIFRFDEEFDFEIDISKVRNHSLKVSICLYNLSINDS